MAELEVEVNRARERFIEIAADFQSPARELVGEPDLLLAKLFFGTIMLGDHRPRESGVRAAVSLELLNRALELGKEQLKTGYREELLLVTDYLYAQAIDEVIAIEEAAVIGILAGAIMAAAADRMEDPRADHRPRLARAALDLGVAIGQIDARAVEMVKAASLRLKIDWPGLWLELMPEGWVREYLTISIEAST